MKNTAAIASALCLVGCCKAPEPAPPPSTPPKPSITATEAYMLQERCAKSSEEAFKRGGYIEGPSHDKDGSNQASYESHYNSKLNKCVLLISSENFPSDKTHHPFNNISLIDVLANKELGALMIQRDWSDPLKQEVWDCSVSDSKCRTRDEFDELAKPYLTE